MKHLSMSDLQRLIKMASGPFSYLNWLGYKRTTYAPLANVSSELRREIYIIVETVHDRRVTSD